MTQYHGAIQDPKLQFHDLPLLDAPAPFVVGHWPGGERGSDIVFTRLNQRRCSIHFTIPLSGSTGQHAGIDRRCSHAGRKGNRGIGVECSNQGFPSKDGTSPRPFTIVRIHDRPVRAVHFTDAQLASWVALCEWLATEHGWPRQVPNVLRLLTPKELARWRGALEHLHLARSRSDAGGYLTGALVKAGWAAVDP